jgi:hypothetical protein
MLLRAIAKTEREEAVTMGKISPALSPEAEENQMIALATNLAKKQLSEGTASSQVITHFLKLATTKAQLEKEKLIQENKLTEAKIKALESAEEIKVLYENALKAMRTYNGQGDSDEY